MKLIDSSSDDRGLLRISFKATVPSNRLNVLSVALIIQSVTIA